MLTSILHCFRYSAVSSPNPVSSLSSPKSCALSDECSRSSVFNSWGSDFCNQSCLVGFLQPCGNYCLEVNYHPTETQPTESKSHHLGQSRNTESSWSPFSSLYSNKPIRKISRNQRGKALLCVPTNLPRLESIAHPKCPPLSIVSLGVRKMLDPSLSPESSGFIQTAPGTFINPSLQTLPAPGVTSWRGCMLN